jgi:hypothetical protein
MAPETFQKRQKEAARREKKKLKLTRKLERRIEKSRGDDAEQVEGAEGIEKLPGDNPGGL